MFLKNVNTILCCSILTLYLNLGSVFLIAQSNFKLLLPLVPVPLFCVTSFLFQYTIHTSRPYNIMLKIPIFNVISFYYNIASQIYLISLSYRALIPFDHPLKCNTPNKNKIKAPQLHPSRPLPFKHCSSSMPSHPLPKLPCVFFFILSHFVTSYFLSHSHPSPFATLTLCFQFSPFNSILFHSIPPRTHQNKNKIRWTSDPLIKFIKTHKTQQNKLYPLHFHPVPFCSSFPFLPSLSRCVPLIYNIPLSTYIIKKMVVLTLELGTSPSYPDLN